MAFKGDLTNISLFDVFQTLNQNKQTGVLVLTRDGHTKKIHISSDGVRIFFSRSFRPLRLGEIFRSRGRITPQDVEILLLEQKRDYRPFGQLLIESGKVSAEEVHEVLRYHAEDEIFEIFSWEHGSFAFFDGQDVDEDDTPLSDVLMDPAGLCLEAARRLDEMERLRERIPSNDEFFLQSEHTEPDREHTSPEVLALYDELAVPCSVNDLRDLVGMSLFDTLKTMHLLLENDLVRALQLEELTTTARAERDAGRLERATQMFEAAHQRDPSNRAVLEECVATMERLGEPRRLGRMLSTLGMLYLEEGRTDEAVEYLEQSLRHDSMQLATLTALRDAFGDQGDSERVGETSLKIARYYADAGQLDAAIESCKAGLLAAPHALGLRYYHGQLLARADRPTLARDELWGLVRDIEESGRTRSPKLVEMLTSCYRLLLKLDPLDAEAQAGLHGLERVKSTTQRRKGMVIRLGAVAALLAIVGVVGLSIGGGDDQAAALLATAEAKRQRDPQAALDAIARLTVEYPESPEAQRALEIRQEIQARAGAALDEQRKRNSKVRKEIEADYAAVEKALANRPYLEAIQQAHSFLIRLREPDARFLHRQYGTAIRTLLAEFVERLGKQFDADRTALATGENKLKAAVDVESLATLESDLLEIRRRNWPSLASELMARLDDVYKEQLVTADKELLQPLRERMKTASTAFGGFDALFYTVRRERLKADIQQSVGYARRRGVDLLRECRFAEARQLFDEAYRKADAITDEEPREYFVPLLRWLTQLRILATMKAEREKIDDVVATLAEVEKLREPRPEAAFRLLRDLVTRYRLIQFEEKYELPYRVVSTPAGARVTVDGKEIGVAPCTISLPIGVKPVMVRVERDGFAPEEARLVPTDPELDGRLDVPLAKRPLWTTKIGGTIEAPPVIADGRLLVATHRSTLAAYDLSSGDVLWEADPKELERVTARPVVAGDHAYLINVAGRIFRIRLSDGEIVGRFAAGGAVHHDAAFANGTLYVATRKLELIALRDGKVRYRRPLAYSPTTGLLLAGDVICVGTAEGRILVHDRRTGFAKAELRATSSFFGGLGVKDDLVVGGAEDGNLYAFRLDGNAPVWSYATRGPISAPPISDGPRVFLPARDGFVHVVGKKGRRAIRYELGLAVEGTALAHGFLYAIGGSRVKAFDVVGEQLWWEFALEDEFAQHVVAAGDHVVLVTSDPRIYVYPKDVR